MGTTLPPLYVHQITLRNCGRFVHVSADFGSEYTTHVHLSSEMLYAGLTRERSRKPRAFRDAMDSYRFSQDFDLRQLPLWFTVAILEQPKSRRTVDVHKFNSTLESVPGVQTNNRLPKYGSMETVLPDQSFRTFAVSPDRQVLEGFMDGQIFWMGKKRTMFQITALDTVYGATWEQGACRTPPIQIGPEEVRQFEAMQVLAATQRCLVVQGQLRDAPYLGLGRHADDRASGIPALALGPLLGEGG